MVDTHDGDGLTYAHKIWIKEINFVEKISQILTQTFGLICYELKLDMTLTKALEPTFSIFTQILVEL